MTENAPDVGDTIVRAIVTQFFAPQIIGVEMISQFMPGFNGQPGGQVLVPTPKYGMSPMGQAASEIFNAKRDEIIEAVTEKIDLNELADKIKDEVLKGLAEKPNYGQSLSPTAQSIQRLVHDKLAGHYTAEAIAHLDAQQAAMRAAYERELRTIELEG